MAPASAHHRHREQPAANGRAPTRSCSSRAASYRLVLKSELAVAQKPRSSTDPLSSAYIHNEIAVLKSWQARLRDPHFVFGEGDAVPTAATPASGAPTAGAIAPPAASPSTGGSGPTAAGPGLASPGGPEAGPPPARHWETKMQVTNAPLMQLIEHGFVRHDDMPARPGAKDPKQVFNAEVATTLARFGFSPGATYRDTMHFDFIEGYTAAPGGRAQANMTKTKYGPSGDIPPAAPKQPAPSAVKKEPR